ncbi:restriction endonuclease subunit S [Mycoplasma sp. AC1221]
MELNINEWKEYKLKDLFKIEKSKNYTVAEIEDYLKGKIPYVTRTSLNNGVSEFVNNNDEILILEKGNCIIIGGESAIAFYQPLNFISGNNISKLYLKNNFFNYEIFLFIITIINKEKYKYNYGRAFNMKNIKNTIIKLPVKQDGTPDWDFMENYIKWLKEKQNKESISLQTIENTAHLSKATNKLKLNISEWREYKLKDLFNFVKGKCSNSTEFEEGIETFYIGAKKENHGVMQNIVSEPTLISKGNCIAFVCQGEGSNGYQFYMPVDAIHTTSNTLGYSKQLNKYNALFITTVLDKERFKWSFGRGRKLDLLKNTIIKLPSKPDGTPDWDFMEEYIKSLPYSKYI